MTGPIKALSDLLAESAERAEAVRLEAQRIIANSRRARRSLPERVSDVQFDHDHEKDEGWTA